MNHHETESRKITLTPIEVNEAPRKMVLHPIEVNEEPRPIVIRKGE